jgi:hypothetical protein
MKNRLAVGFVATLAAAGVAIGRPASNQMPIEAAVKDAYAREYDEVVLRPAIFKQTLAGGCRADSLTTTAYFRSTASSARLLYLHMSPDGQTVTRKAEVASVLSPAGRFRFLTVIVNHPATVDGTSLEQWQGAQKKINQDHASFASSRGLAEPIVSFDNTNAFIESAELTDPRSLPAVRESLHRKRITTRDYQFIAVINLDPSRSEGGFARGSVSAGDLFVYMGNYSRWTRRLTDAEWTNVADAVYHHEVAHHWGWPGSHDWAPCRRGPLSYEPFIVPPVLFGWEDVDGDGVPEILDTTPYGRSHVARHPCGDNGAE